MELRGRLAVVTGGTDGIGREIARHLQAGGAEVIVVGRDEAKLVAARAEGFEALSADLSTPAGCDAAVAALRGRPIDILVNNAGIGATYEFDGPIDPDEVDRCIYLNLAAPVRLIAGLLPLLRARPEATIVNVSSGLAIAPSAKGAVYCATKAGLKSFTASLRAQLAGSNVHVIEALPPVVETQMTVENPHKKMPAAECARHIVAAIVGDRAYANVGITRVLDLVFNLSPPLARRIMLNY